MNFSQPSFHGLFILSDFNFITNDVLWLFDDLELSVFFELPTIHDIQERNRVADVYDHLLENASDHFSFEVNASYVLSIQTDEDRKLRQEVILSSLSSQAQLSLKSIKSKQRIYIIFLVYRIFSIRD